MVIRVEQGKGRKDRYVMLFQRLLEELRVYWKAFRPVRWLFEGRVKGQPLSLSTAEKVFSSAASSSRYRPSPRVLPKTLPAIEYPAHYEVRYVSANGGIRWKCAWVGVTHTLAGEFVGLGEVGDGLWDVYFGAVLLGRMDERMLRIEDHRGRWIRRRGSPMSPD